jgi:hypothetical protein
MIAKRNFNRLSLNVRKSYIEQAEAQIADFT